MFRRATIAAAVLFALSGAGCVFRPIFHPPTDRANEFGASSSNSDAARGEAGDPDDPATASTDSNGRFAGVPAAHDGGSPAADASQEGLPSGDGGRPDGFVKDDGPAPIPADRLSDSIGLTAAVTGR